MIKSHNRMWQNGILYTLAASIVTILMFVIAMPLYLIRGFVFMKLWNWFVFGQLSNFNMGWIVASGISMLVGWATAFTVPVKDESTKQEKIIRSTAEYFVPFLILFFGWILHLFV